MSKLQKVVLIILAVLALMVIGAYAFLQAQLNKINRVTAAETEYTTEDFEEDTEEPDTITEVNWGENDVELPTSEEGIVNILLVGQDTRVPGQRARSDSMMVMCVNTKNKSISVVSLMRDLYVQIPGYSNNRINAAYAFGGFELLDATIEANFGITIDYNVEVDFNGFQKIIDTIGGVDVKLNADEVAYLNGSSTSGNKYRGCDPIPGLSVGYNHLNGQAALAYARIRHVNTDDSHDDYGRTQRQRIIIQNVYSQIKDVEWTKLLGIYAQVADTLTTDMTNDEILSIGLSAYNMGVSNIKEYRVPADGSYTGETIHSMMVLVPINWDTTRADLKEFLYG